MPRSVAPASNSMETGLAPSGTRCLPSPPPVIPPLVMAPPAIAPLVVAPPVVAPPASGSPGVTTGPLSGPTVERELTDSAAPWPVDPPATAPDGGVSPHAGVSRTLAATSIPAIKGPAEPGTLGPLDPDLSLGREWGAQEFGFTVRGASDRVLAAFARQAKALRHMPPYGDAMPLGTRAAPRKHFTSQPHILF